MSHNIESLFYAGESVWHGLGTRVAEAQTSKEAIVLAGLDWQVQAKNLFLDDKTPVSGFVANVRDRDNQVLGVVTDAYKIVQNDEAFAFVDGLVGNGVIDVKYETAGSLSNGKRVWMLVKMPDENIVGDKFENYLVFTNSFDGTGAIRAAMTPVRVVCQNTLNMALRSAQRQWSVKHMGDMQSKMREAQQTLGLYSKYMTQLKEEADVLSQKTVTDTRFMDFVDELFPKITSITATPRQINNAEQVRNSFLSFRNAPYDLKRIEGTAWGFMNLVSDFVSHVEPMRKSQNFKENNFMHIIDGHPIFDKAYALVKTI